MYQNRISLNQFGSYFLPPIHELNAHVLEVLDSIETSPKALSKQDIYRIALEKARQDYELNRLFNPDLYNEDDVI